METLPNNLADWPARKSWLTVEPGSRGMLKHVAARLALLIVVGLLVGFGAYCGASIRGEVVSPPPLSVTTPAQDVPASTTPDATLSTPADASAPDLDLTGLIGNHTESQNWSGYAATDGSYTGVSANWALPDSGSRSPSGE